jgi:hypothetical protein
MPLVHYRLVRRTSSTLLRNHIPWDASSSARRWLLPLPPALPLRLLLRRPLPLRCTLLL